MNVITFNDFIFSRRYRIWRHIAFWVVFTFLTATIFSSFSKGLWGLHRTLFLGLLWLPVRILYCYPLMYWVVPEYLLKGKYLKFAFIILIWLIAGTFINYLFRAYVFIPVQEAMHIGNIVRDPWSPGSFLLLTTAAGCTSIIILFKYWFRKQQEWLRAEKEKVTAELQLLKAQVHPHFLFNTLNNIYSYSLEKSPQTPGLILKLSSLLSYMLYDCKAEKVPLEKEVEIMKDYADLEKVRYGNRIEISWNTEGDISGKVIAPLLLLPFLENAFKHGTSGQIERPWLSVDISIEHNRLSCKIVNSKNEVVPVNQNGIGVQNAQKRLSIIYPDRHLLRINDEGNFFVVSLLIDLVTEKKIPSAAVMPASTVESAEV